MINSLNSDARGRGAARAAGITSRIAFILLCLLFLTGCNGGCNLFGGDAKNYFMVVDTSGSMGGKDDPLIDKVKTSVGQLLKNPVRDGDTVRLLTFDEQLTLQETAQIKGDDSRKALEEKVAALAAQKKNTDMQGMILALRDLTSRIKNEDAREQIIIILSDGKDAPGPRRRKGRFSLSELRKERPGFLQDDHIFYVSLTDAQSEKIVSKIKKDFPNTQVVGVKAVKKGKGGDAGTGKGGTGGTTAGGGGTTGDGDNTGGTGGNRKAGTGDMSDVVKTIRGNVAWNNILKYWWVAAILLALILLLVLIWILMRKHRMNNKPEGFLNYYEDGVSFPTKSTYRLDRLETNKFSLGSRFGVNLRVKTLDLPQDFVFTCRKNKNEPTLRPTGKSAGLIKPIAQKASGVYSFGDSFQIGNMIFEFSEERE